MKGEFIAFQNDVQAMKARIAELEPLSVTNKSAQTEASSHRIVLSEHGWTKEHH